MSKAIMVKDDTYYLVKAYAQKWNDSLSGTVERSIKFSIETDKMQGINFGNSPGLLELYNKTFVEKPMKDNEEFKKKLLDYISKYGTTLDSGIFKVLNNTILDSKKVLSKIVIDNNEALRKIIADNNELLIKTIADSNEALIKAITDNSAPVGVEFKNKITNFVSSL